MVVLLTCKNEIDPIKMKALKCSQHNILIFLRRSRATNSVVGGGILQKFKLIQGFMHDLVTCKNKEDPMKNEGAGVFTTFISL